MQTIRTFIAIELDSAIQETIRHIEELLKKTGIDAKWVKPNDIHLTLKFLGDTPIDKIEPIVQIIQTTAQTSQIFSIELTQLGAYPQIEKPRVIWIGVNRGRDETKKIVLLLKEELEKIGFVKEKRDFDPHVTIGRLRSAQNHFALFKAIKEFQINPTITQEVTHITFLKSTLTPQGPIYETLQKIDFKKS